MNISSLCWSDNSRYLSYGFADKGGRKIGVYDLASGRSKHVQIPSGELGLEALLQVKLSDDGLQAVIVKESGLQPALSRPAGGDLSLMLGSLSAGKITVEYKHTLGSEDQYAWLNSDQIAFVGTDGTLFAYNRRNGAVSVLQDRMEKFQLSSDRRSIAYSTDDAAVHVANLQGNSLLNKKTVYKGINPSQLVWSPDSGKLLVQGQKPYRGQPAIAPGALGKTSGPAPAPAQAPLAGADSQLFIIDFL